MTKKDTTDAPEHLDVDTVHMPEPERYDSSKEPDPEDQEPDPPHPEFPLPFKDPAIKEWVFELWPSGHLTASLTTRAHVRTNDGFLVVDMATAPDSEDPFVGACIPEGIAAGHIGRDGGSALFSLGVDSQRCTQDVPRAVLRRVLLQDTNGLEAA